MATEAVVCTSSLGGNSKISGNPAEPYQYWSSAGKRGTGAKGRRELKKKTADKRGRKLMPGCTSDQRLIAPEIPTRDYEEVRVLGRQSTLWEVNCFPKKRESSTREENKEEKVGFWGKSEG